MNLMEQNGITVETGCGIVKINGEKIPMPKGMIIGNTTVINGSVFIGGYEYNKETKTFKKTLRAIFHLLF